MSDVFLKLSEELKNARLSSGLSTEQIVRRIKIDPHFLRKMENGDFSFLPDIFLKPFLKEYALAVGLDPQVILKKFELAKKGEDYSLIPEQELTSPAGKESKDDLPKRISTVVVDAGISNPEPEVSSRTSHQKVYLLAAAGLILLVFLAVYLLFIKKSDQIIITNQNVDELFQEENRFSEEPAESKFFSSDSLYLEIAATDSSWIEVTIDDNKTSEYYLRSGNKINVSSTDNFVITIGNSRGISLLLNNEPVNFKKDSGLVVRMKIDRNGFVYLAPPKRQ